VRVKVLVELAEKERRRRKKTKAIKKKKKNHNLSDRKEIKHWYIKGRTN